MERNPNDDLGVPNTGANKGFGASTGGAGTSGGYGAGGAGAGGYGAGAAGGSATAGTSGTSGAPGTSGAGYGTTGSTGGDFAGGQEQSRVQQGREKAKEKLGQVRERAGELKSSLADKLEAGAERLRQRSTSGSAGGGTMAAATSDGGTTAGVSEDRMAKMSGAVAGGMESTARWIRDADMETLKTDVEQQVKEHPGRTLLIALGLGYVLGKAFRR